MPISEHLARPSRRGWKGAAAGVIAAGAAAVVAACGGRASGPPTTAGHSPKPQGSSSAAPFPSRHASVLPTGSSEPAGTDGRGFSTRIQTLFRRGGSTHGWKSYDDRSPMTNEDGYYLDHQVGLNADGDITLSGSVGPAHSLTPDGVEHYKRTAGSVFYFDQPRVYGRWTVEARFPHWDVNAIHDVIMLWPNDDDWTHGEADAVDKLAVSQSGQAFIHGNDPQNPVQSEPFALDDSWHKITLEWTPTRGVQIFIDDAKHPVASLSPKLFAPVPHRLTFQADAEGADQNPVGGSIKAQPAIEVRNATYQPYMGRELSSSGPSPSAVYASTQAVQVIGS